MTNENEPIYPNKDYGNIGAIGLTKKEFFSITILQGMCNRYGVDKPDWDKEMVKRALRLTDELIKQLNEKNSSAVGF